jgi:hypothetical protein
MSSDKEGRVRRAPLRWGIDWEKHPPFPRKGPNDFELDLNFCLLARPNSQLRIGIAVDPRSSAEGVISPSGRD